VGSKSDKGKLEETAQEKMLAQIAVEENDRYKKTWLPLQQKAIQMTEKMNAPDSFERDRARGRAAGVGTEIDMAAEDIAKQDQNRGVNAGSSNFVMRQGKLGEERAKSVGIATANAEDAIDDAYVQGLASLVRSGRNKGDVALDNMGRSAATSAANEASGAAAGAARRSGNMQLAGTVIGAGTQVGRGIQWGQGQGSGTGFGFSGANEAAPYTPGVNI
jgi:hypothetical protein